jgi:hypothetical protein
MHPGAVLNVGKRLVYIGTVVLFRRSEQRGRLSRALCDLICE